MANDQWRPALIVAAAVWETEILRGLGREDEARSLATEADQIGRKVLEQRPDYRSLLHELAIIELDMGQDASIQLDPAAASANEQRGLELNRRLLNADPDNSSAVNNTAVNLMLMGDAAWAQGEATASFDDTEQATKIFEATKDRGAWFIFNSLNQSGTYGQRLADAGLDDRAQAARSKLEANFQTLKSTTPGDSRLLTFAQCTVLGGQASIDMGLAKWQAVRTEAAEGKKLVAGLEANAPFEGLMKYNSASPYRSASCAVRYTGET